MRPKDAKIGWSRLAKNGTHDGTYLASYPGIRNLALSSSKELPPHRPLTYPGSRPQSSAMASLNLTQEELKSIESTRGRLFQLSNSIASLRNDAAKGNPLPTA